MTIRLRTAFFIGLILITGWFLYLEHAILTPFILAAIFAYIFNPLVNFFYHRIRLPRIVSVIIIYIALISLMGFIGMLLVRQATDESYALRGYVKNFTESARVEVATLPAWIQPTANETLTSLEKSKLFQTQSIFLFFPQAISRIVSLFIFLFAGFYFLKEGRGIFDKILAYAPNDYRFELEVLLQKINAVLNGYLRGQVFLIVLVSAVLYIALTILGVKFALIIAIFSGFAEIVPIIGPIVAGGVAAAVAFISGTANFPMPPMTAALVVILVYFVARQLEDYFVIPFVMGHITKLHPLIILFAVLAGEHLWGILGLILAVPIAAIIRIFLEYTFNKFNTRQEASHLKHHEGH